MAYADLYPINLPQKSLGVVVRLKKYCSEITFSLMQPESQLRSIQCDGSNFPLDIFEFPSFLYVYKARPYHWSFLEGHLDYQNTHLSCAQLIRGGIPPWTTYHSYLTHEILSLTQPLPFICPRITMLSTRAQCLIYELGL